ncbi:MAG: hypothetical protein JNG88_17805 [Phycisphaerales bacterium]|nr:hypothetical protein [Phycisphaerales bacterium]
MRPPSMNPVGQLTYLLICSVVALTGESAAQEWAVTDLGDLGPGSEFVAAYDLNNRGQVTVDCLVYVGNDPTLGCLWSHGQLQALPEPSGARSARARAINDAGDMAGDANYAADTFPYLWTNGQVISLGTLGTGRVAVAFGINASAQVVGASLLDDSPFPEAHAFLWNDSLIDLGTFTGGSTEDSVAYDINDDGVIVGSSQRANQSGYTIAVMWQDGQIVDLGALPGDRWSEAVAINNLGQIVGTSAQTYDANGKDAVLWSDGQIIQIGPLEPPTPPYSHFFSECFDINDFGEIVGRGIVNPYLTVGFLWRNGEFTLTTELVPSGFEWRLVNPVAINNAGQIACTGIHSIETWRVRAFVLTPPECRGFPRGDANCDGAIDNFDIDPFVDALTNVDRYAAEHGACNWLCNLDINRDGVVNNFDIDPFVMLLAGG